MKKRLTIVVLAVVACISMVFGLVGCGTNCSHESYGEWTEKTAATCYAEGVEVAKCNNCSHTKERPIPMLDHVMSGWTSVDDSNLEERHCTNANCTFNETRMDQGEFYNTLATSITSQNVAFVIDNLAITVNGINEETGEVGVSNTVVFEKMELLLGSKEGKPYFYGYAKLPDELTGAKDSEAFIILDNESGKIYIYNVMNTNTTVAEIPLSFFGELIAPFASAEIPEELQAMLDTVALLFGDLLEKNKQGIEDTKVAIINFLFDFEQTESKDGYKLTFTLDNLKELNNTLYTKSIAELLGEDGVQFVKDLPDLTIGEIMDYLFNDQNGLDVDTFVSLMDMVMPMIMGGGMTDGPSNDNVQMLSATDEGNESAPSFEGMFDAFVGQMLLEMGMIEETELETFTFKGLIANKEHPLMKLDLGTIIATSMEVENKAAFETIYDAVIDEYLAYTPWKLLYVLSGGASNPEANEAEDIAFAKEMIDGMIDQVASFFKFEILTDELGNAKNIQLDLTAEGVVTGIIKLDYDYESEVDYASKLPVIQEAISKYEAIAFDANHSFDTFNRTFGNTAEEYKNLRDGDTTHSTTSWEVVDDKVTGIKVVGNKVIYDGSSYYQEPGSSPDEYRTERRYWNTSFDFTVDLDNCMKLYQFNPEEEKDANLSVSVIAPLSNKVFETYGYNYDMDNETVTNGNRSMSGPGFFTMISLSFREIETGYVLSNHFVEPVFTTEMMPN